MFALKQPRRWLPTGAAIAVFALALVVFQPVRNHAFLTWDDGMLVATNPDFQPVTGTSFTRYWLEAPHKLYMPVTYNAWAAVAKLSQWTASANEKAMRPGPFHTLNWLLHATNAALVFWLLVTWLRTLWPATLAAALFAVHPLATESVAWVAEFKGLLATLLGLLCLLCYSHAYRSSPESDHNTNTGRFSARHKRLYAGALAAFVLALLAKPTAAAIPLMLVVVELLVLQRPWRKAATSLLPYALLLLPYVLLVRAVQPLTLTHTPAPLWLRPLVALDTYAFYLWKVFDPRHLAIDYSRTPTHIVDAGIVYWSWTIPIALALAGLWWHRRTRDHLLPAGLLLAATAVLPVSGLIPFAFQNISTVADRYAYLALVGIALALGAVLQSLQSRSTGAGRLACGAVLLACVALAQLTQAQIAPWRDNEPLNQHALSVNPQSCIAHTNLSSICLKRNDVKGAIAYGKKAVELGPNNADAHNNLGSAYFNAGLKAMGIKECKRALELRPDDALYLQNIAVAELAMGELQSADEHFERSVAILPRNPKALALWGQTLTQLGRPADALDLFERATAIAPRYADAYYFWALANKALGNLDEAGTQLRHATQLQPRDAASWLQLGLVEHENGHNTEAVAALTRAAQLNPQDLETKLHLGLAQLAVGKAALAAKSLEQVVQSQPHNAHALHAWGKALVQLKQEPRAFAAFARALEQQPTRAEVHVDWARAYLKSGRTQLAAQHARAALRMQPDLIPAQELQRELDR